MSLKVAVIGCGYWGKNLIRNFSELGALSAVSDTNINLAKDFSKKYGVPALNFEDVLSMDCDGVVLAVPASLHESLAIKSFKAKKHVFVEKPLALTLEDARNVIDASLQANRSLMIGHLLQYHPVFLSLLEKVKKGELGSLKYMYSNRLSMGKVRSEEDVIWSFAPHDISMLLALAQDKVSSVFCKCSYLLQKNIADTAMLHLEFSKGLNAHISCSWIHPYKEQKLVVQGEKAIAVFDDTQEWKKKLAIYPYSIDKSQKPLDLEKQEPIFIEAPEKEPLKEECLHFLKIMSDNISARTNGEEGLAVLEVLTAASSSINRGGVVYA